MEDFNCNHIPGAEDWELVAMASGGLVAWWEIRVCYSPGTQKYYWDIQTGCSCYGFEWDANELPAPKSWRDVVYGLRAVDTGDPCGFDPVPKASDIDRLVREVENHARKKGLR